MQGLEQQLLGRVVQRERAELEEQRQKLVEEVNANLKLLKGLEDDLLYRLANSTGNLLDDTSLIEVRQSTLILAQALTPKPSPSPQLLTPTPNLNPDQVLQNTKTTSAEVQSKLENAEQTDARINAAREEYRPVATRGSLLYFLITDMAAVNSMYQVGPVSPHTLLRPPHAPFTPPYTSLGLLTPRYAPSPPPLRSRRTRSRCSSSSSSSTTRSPTRPRRRSPQSESSTSSSCSPSTRPATCSEVSPTLPFTPDPPQPPPWP
jgi:hypothetical protein